MSIDYLAAAVWLPDGTFDLGAALDASSETDWSEDRFGGPAGYGYVWSNLLEELEQLAANCASHASWGDDDATATWEDLNEHVERVERQAAARLDGADPAGTLTKEVAAAQADVFVAILACELFLGRDTTYNVEPGQVVAFGAVDQGAYGDRSSIHMVRAVVSLPAFGPVLRAGGAHQPADWQLTPRSA